MSRQRCASVARTSRYGTPRYVSLVLFQNPEDAASPAEQLRCSAKGCRAGATIDLQWRNPRLHDAARVKHWLACEGHTEHLADFLDRRGFLLARSPL